MRDPRAHDPALVIVTGVLLIAAGLVGLWANAMGWW